MIKAVAGADSGHQGVDPRGGVSRQGEVDVLVIGAVADIGVHGLHPAQGLPLEHDFTGNGDGDGQVLRGEDGVLGGQGKGGPGVDLHGDEVTSSRRMTQPPVGQ